MRIIQEWASGRIIYFFDFYYCRRFDKIILEPITLAFPHMYSGVNVAIFQSADLRQDFGSI